MPSNAYFMDDSQQRSRMFLQLITFFGMLFVFAAFRLVYVQIIQGEYHTRLSIENMMRLKIIKAPRGRIFDRNGHLLVRNRVSQAIAIYPYKVKGRKKLFTELYKLRSLDGTQVFAEGELEKIYRKALARRFDPTILREDVSMDLASIILEHSLDIPGVGIETEIRREYPYGTLGSHLFGYISEIPETKLDSLKNFGYGYGDLLGKAGVEMWYEDMFRGMNGREYIEVNAFGKELGALVEMPSTPPVRGYDMYLTIDFDLQKAAEDAFGDSLKGAVVVLDPRNGEILALLSSPRPDPNLFTFSSSKRTRLWAEVALDPRLPLNNRSIQGTYPPGSTFKMATAVTALETGLASPSDHFSPCTGGFHFGRKLYRCWEPKGHGTLGMIDAITRSCDVYFYQLGLLVGDKNLNKYARKLGFEDLSGIDLPGEKRGLLLGEESYNKKFKDRGWIWTRGQLLNIAIGQGQAVTPIQLADYIAGLGNGNRIYKPHVVRKFSNIDGVEAGVTKPEVRFTFSFKPHTIETIHEALYDVVNTPHGTGGRSRIPGVRVGGKSGSAENPQGKLTHALFVACAPVDSPTIAVSVVVENAGHGGGVAGPIAGRVLQKYFEKLMPKADSVKVKILEEAVRGD